MSGRIELEGKTALVTGAAKRLGKATALALADNGVNVVVHYRKSEAEARRTAEAIRDRGANAWTIAADITDYAAADALVEQSIELAGGPLDILVNNASIFREDRLVDMTMDSLELNVRVHATGPLLLARKFAVQGSASGAIVNFLDARIVDYDANHVSYLVSKRMLFILTRMMALELAPRIRVNAVAPGLILPPKGKTEAYLNSLVSPNPLHTHGGPDDITDAVLFLLRSPFVTGQVLYVDGGRHLRGGVYA